MTASVLKQDLNTKRFTEQDAKTQPKQDKYFSLIFHGF